MSTPRDIVSAEVATSAGGEVGATNSVQSQHFAYWQRRTLIWATIGYALYYFVRKNLSVAMPFMEEELGISKTQLGVFLTANGLLYGISKFVNGIIGDRVNARWFMVSGLVICGLINIQFGLSTTLVAFGVLWAANGWFQGIGFPPCARLMTHWFPPSRFATKMAIWNSSHAIGAGLVVVLCGYLAPIDWRLCFFVPGAIALVGAAALAVGLRDTPESMGFPPVEGTEQVSETSEAITESLRRRVFDNPFIWMLSSANFFVYAVRYGVFDWGPTFLKDARGLDIKNASWIVAGYEFFGLLGMLFGGWITDRIFGGRPARACLVYMLFCTVALLLFWLWPNPSMLTSGALLCAAGFFIYGPQSLVGTAAANLATKKAAASAVGLTGLFGYASTTLSGVGIGVLAQHYGWNAGFMLFVGCAAAAFLLFALCWPADAHGYARSDVILSEVQRSEESRTKAE